MILEIIFFIIAVFLMTVFGGFIFYSWNIPLGIIGVFSVLLFLLVYKRMVAVDAQVSEEQRSTELWRQEHKAVNFIIYLFALVVAVGAGYFACEKHLSKEFGKNEGKDFSNMKNLVKPIETTLAGMEQRDKEIKNLCQQINDQQSKIKDLGSVVEELRKSAVEKNQGSKKEKDAWLEKIDKTNQSLQSAIKEMEQLKAALSAQEKSFKEIINKDIKGSLDKIKMELEAGKKQLAPSPTPAPTPAPVPAPVPTPAPAKPDQSPAISVEEDKTEKEGENK